MINLKYQFIRRLLGISLSICTAYGAMRSAFVMAGTLDTTPGAVLVAEAKTEQTANIAEARADGTAASGEEVNEFVIEEISEDIEAIEDVEVNEDIEAVEDIDQEEVQQPADAASSPSREMPESQLTEALAHIYIKQKQYGKARKIIQRIAERKGDRNRFLIDQLRFLDKLIINESNT